MSRTARLLVGLAALSLVMHLVTVAISPYGIHRDEFLYMAMGEHLRLWRMDFPPGIAIVSRVMRGLLGDGLLAVRLAPALAGAALVLLAGLTAREMGGGRGAQLLAALAILLNPLFVRAAALFQPVVFDQLAWTVALYALMRLGREDRPRWWLLLGAAGGIGLLFKFSIGFIGVGVLAALLLGPLRRSLLTRWPYVALGLALLLGSPAIVGQVRLGYPVVGQLGDLQQTQLERVGPVEFLTGHLLYGPATLLGLAGLAALLAWRPLRPYRGVGIACLASVALLLLFHGKPYYGGPIYPVLVAAGAVAIGGVASGRTGTLLRGASAAALILYGLLVLPLGLPVLAPPAMARYAAALGVTEATETNSGEVLELPQDYADMLGWEEQVRTIAGVYRSLTPEQQRAAVIVAGNYGEAGAIDYYGPRHGLPKAVSAAGSYWFFGPGSRTGEVVIAVGVPRDSLVPVFDSVRTAAVSRQRWVVPEEREVPVQLAFGIRAPLQAIWPSLAGRN